MHMNGRIYDPTLGRFLQADPHIQAPHNSQNYNRYSYVLNNPMSYTDPSGYFFTASSRRSIIRGFSKVFGKDVTNFLGNIAAYAVGGPLGNAAWTYEFNRAMGVPPSGALRAAAVAGTSAYAFQQIGDYYNNAGAQNIADARSLGNMSEAAFGSGAGQASFDASMDALINFGGNMLTSGQVAGQIFSHAMVGGIAADLGGGKFGHGFWSAGFTKGAGTSLNTHYNNGIISGTIINATVGGTASVLSGGKFANGAITGAYQSLYNEFSSRMVHHAVSVDGTLVEEWRNVGSPHIKSIDEELGFGLTDITNFGAGKAMSKLFNAPWLDVDYKFVYQLQQRYVLYDQFRVDYSFGYEVNRTFMGPVYLPFETGVFKFDYRLSLVNHCLTHKSAVGC
ncbi:RHS repeat-associated core domain-containing protein [Psychrosphaera sp. 1_MG-2023]|nr:RHS repeat-associated core domain-containing protein [Psychrosphaera sp. 1_MG-2023]MDO6718541.1 RHS repeat-associated core domain-containing protein [Psychrosphaera sp. 1_MG-2023]